MLRNSISGNTMMQAYSSNENQKKVNEEQSEKPDLVVLPRVCAIQKPPCRLSVLMILVLQNVENKALTYPAVTKLICHLFPYYHIVWQNKKGYKSLIHAASHKTFSSCFLRGRSSKDLMVIKLNPAEECTWRNHVENSVKRSKTKFKASMSEQGMLEVLINGQARLDLWINLDEKRKGQDVNAKSMENRKTTCLETEDNSHSHHPLLLFSRNNYGGPIMDSNQSMQPSSGSFHHVACITYVFRDQSPHTNKAYDFNDDNLPESFCDLNASLSAEGNFMTCTMSSESGPSNMEISRTSHIHDETATLSKDITDSVFPEVARKMDEIPVTEEYEQFHVTLEGITGEINDIEKNHISALSKDKSLKGISTNGVPPNWKIQLTNRSLKPDKNVIGKNVLFAADNVTCTLDSEINFGPDMNSSDSASVTGAVNLAPQKLQLVMSRQEEKFIPSGESCAPIWKKRFPWMGYSKAGHYFMCKICYWGNVDIRNTVIYMLKNPSDVYLVAEQLKIHENIPFHRKFATQRKIVCQLLQHMHSYLKSNLFKSVTDIIDALSSHASGKFLCYLFPTEKTHFVSYAIRYIAMCKELNLLRSLKESPFFSVVAFEEMDYAVLRWLNHEGKPEEHFFSNQISCPGMIMSISYYLRKKYVDMTKMVSYNNFPTPLSMYFSNDGALQIPVRGPPLNVCLKWLEQTELLKNIFFYLEILVKLCKKSLHKFLEFPEVYEIARVEEPYGHNCIVNEKIIEFSFKNFKELKKLSREIYIETGSMEAYSLYMLEIENNEAVQFWISLLPQLHSLLNREIYYFPSPCTALEEFRNQINCKRSSSDMDHRIDEVRYLLDTYLSHLIILATQNQGNTEIFTKKLKNLNIKIVDEVLTKTQADYIGGSKQCLQDLDACCGLMSVNEDCTIMDLLEGFFTKSDLHQTFPHLLKLYQRMSVLPCFCADIEQYKFDVMSSHMFLKSKVSHELVPPLALILLEGSSDEKTGFEIYLAHWSMKWIMNID